MAATLLLAAGAAWAAGDADGIIVKLRDAPAHADVAREKAQSGDQRSARGEAARQKLDRVLREAGVDQPGIDVPSAPRIRSAGRDAQLLRYDRPLTQDEAERLVKRLRERPDVEWAVPNTLEQRQQSAPDNTSTPSDPLFGGLDRQWWLLPVQGTNTNVLNGRLRGVPGFQSAWASRGNGIGMAAAPVAVLDSGILFDHPDLPASQLLPGYDFVSDATAAGDGDGEDDNPLDEGDFCGTASSSWHGTKIAGLIAARTNNGTGVAAIHWAGQVLPVRIAGRCGARVLDIVNGIRWAAGLEVDGVPVNPNPARVINISYGGTAACDSAYQAAIDEVRTEKGAVVIAAAGNEQKAPTRPANCDNVIGVGALNRDGFKATYSNFGNKLVISTVGGDPTDRGAWGSRLGDTGLRTITNLGTQTAGPYDYGYVFGTSFSAPLVSGTVSLMLGLNPELTADDIVKGLKLSSREHVKSAYIGACSSSNPGRCICSTTTCGEGILDADQALAFALDPGSYVRPSSLDNDVVVDSADVISAVNANAQDVTINTEPAGPCGRDGVCSGAMQPGWLLGLLGASAALLWRRRGRAARAGARA
ncbi:S8 family peptidase [Azohydromonas aeria]|uniref:S8 family peptidase n=1 Tax=Azohydromonas aeria TaxID=2590212 RepID=UPI0012FA50C5|nr:S8 family peptidase [Azohydromonas aeria]